MKTPSLSEVSKAFRINFPTIADTMKPSDHKNYSEEELKDYYKFRISHSEGFTSTPCLCQVLDQNELNNYKDHTRGY